MNAAADAAFALQDELGGGASAKVQRLIMGHVSALLSSTRMQRTVMRSLALPPGASWA